MKTLLKKLQEVQQELHAPKSQFNSFGKYNFRNLEDILQAVKPLLNKVDASIIISDEVVMLGERFYVKASVRFVDDSGEILVTGYARESETKKGMDTSQITGASSSYARKYALNGLLEIDDTKDADSQDNSNKVVKPQINKPKADTKEQKDIKIQIKQNYLEMNISPEDVENYISKMEGWDLKKLKELKQTQDEKLFSGGAE